MIHRTDQMLKLQEMNRLLVDRLKLSQEQHEITLSSVDGYRTETQDQQIIIDKLRDEVNHLTARVEMFTGKRKFGQ